MERMGKEVKLGLVVISSLLMAFVVVVYYRFAANGNVPLADAEPPEEAGLDEGGSPGRLPAHPTILRGDSSGELDGNWDAPSGGAPLEAAVNQPLVNQASADRASPLSFFPALDSEIEPADEESVEGGEDDRLDEAPLADFEQPPTSLPPREAETEIARASVVERESFRATARAPRGGTTYVVQAGDALFDIARHELGDAVRWLEIYEANRERIGDELDDLPEGMELVLPDAAASPRT